MNTTISRFTYGHKVTLKGNCVVCEKYVERTVTTAIARNTKALTCGGWRCQHELTLRRSRERDQKLKLKGVKR